MHDGHHAHAPTGGGRTAGANPVLVEVTRGGVVESRHRGAVAVVAADGTVVTSWGDVHAPVFPRSAIKPVQSLPLVESGAADAFALSDVELALACASHMGEPAHVAAVEAFLQRVGSDTGALECGGHWPSSERCAHDLSAAGGHPLPVHNNCSGKHAGMIATAIHKGENPAGYSAVTHPVQQRVLGVFESMTGCDLSHAPRGVDGCSVPVWAMPLGNLALAMARMADPSDQPPARQEAAARLRAAMAAEPFYVHGTGMFATEVIGVAGPDVLVKGGAEGVYTAILAEDGLGVALKIDDGAGRAAEVAMAAVLRGLGVLDSAAEAALAHRFEPELTNWAGRAVGSIRATAELTAHH